MSKKKGVIAALAIILVAAAVIAAVLIPKGGSEMKVGKKISYEDITEFYYTESSSAYPPTYQRYRFYVEDGKRMFFHEKREGDTFPLTEADATVTGTKELTEEEWQSFLNCVDGGEVEKRTESTESGGSGPWLYLYWKKDKGKYQEFTFASYDKQVQFEELCKALAQ